MKHYSDIKKNKRMPLAATWMDLEIIILSEISQRWFQSYVEPNFKKLYKCTFLQNENHHRYWKQAYSYQMGNVRGGRINQELGILVAQTEKASACNQGDLGSISGSGRFPSRREWLPTPVFLPAEFHGQRLQAMGSQRVGYNWAKNTFTWIHFAILHLRLIKYYKSTILQ